jgi:hypothetical protein
MDVVNAYTKKKHAFGIDGYEIPKFNPYFDKVRNVVIKGGEKKTFLDDVIRKHRDSPSPTNYEVVGSIINPKKLSGLSKGPRITLPVEIEKKALKELKPGPGEY